MGVDIQQFTYTIHTIKCTKIQTEFFTHTQKKWMFIPYSSNNRTYCLYLYPLYLSLTNNVSKITFDKTFGIYMIFFLTSIEWFAYWFVKRFTHLLNKNYFVVPIGWHLDVWFSSVNCGCVCRMIAKRCATLNCNFKLTIAHALRSYI